MNEIPGGYSVRSTVCTHATSSTDTNCYICLANTERQQEAVLSASSSSNREEKTFFGPRQRYVVKNVEAKRQTSRTAQTRLFRQRRCEIAQERTVVKDQQAINFRQRYTEPVSHLKQGETSFKWYHDWFYRSDVLRNLLVKARSESYHSTITQEDFNRVIECCQKRGDGLFDSKFKCQILGFRILHYLAENRIHLPNQAIQSLIQSCRELNAKTLPYASMALGYTIFHDRSISFPKDIDKVINNCIEKLKDNTREHLEVIMILMAAKTMLNSKKCKISKWDISQIRKWIECNSFRLYRDISKCSVAHQSEHLSFWSRTITKLRSIKEGLRQEESVSEKELTFAMECYHNSDDRMKNRVLTILQLATLNGQYHFTQPQKELLVTILNDALSENEYKLRNRALVIAKLLKQKQSLIFDPGLKGNLARARYQELFHALTTFQHYLYSHRLSEDVDDWIRLLKKIEDNINYKSNLRYLARYIRYQIQNNQKSLKKLLFKRKYSLIATAAFLNMARRKKRLKPEVIQALAKLTEERYSAFDQGVRINVMGIFRYLIENRQSEEMTAIGQVVNYAISELERDHLISKQAALQLIATSLPIYGESIKNSQLLDRIINCITKKKLINPCCFVLSNWLDILIEPQFELEFTSLFLRIVEWLRNQDLSEKKKMSLTRVLAKGIDKGFPFSTEMVQDIIEIALSSRQAVFKYRCAQVITAYLNTQQTYFWSQNLFNLAFGLSQSENEVHFLQGGTLISRFIEILDVLPPSEQTDQLASLFLKKETLDLGLDLFVHYVKKNWITTVKSIEIIAESLRTQSGAASIDMTLLLGKIADIQPFSSRALAIVIENLSSIEAQVVTSSIHIIHKNIMAIRGDLKNLARCCLEPLMVAARTLHYSLNDRLKALSILTDLSQNTNLVFPLEILDGALSLLDDQNSTIRAEVIRLISLHMNHLSVLIKNKNPFMHTIEASVIKHVSIEKNTLHVLKTLHNMTSSSYDLSFETLEKISDTLYHQGGVDVFLHVFEILKLNLDRLSERTNKLKNIQESIQRLKDVELRKSAIEHLNSCIESKCRIPIYTYELLTQIVPSLAELILDSNGTSVLSDAKEKMEFFQAVLEFCDVVLRNEGSVPSKLLQQICLIPKEQITPENQKWRSLLIANCLKRNNAIDPSAFSMIEEEVNKEVNENLMIFIEALHVIVKRGFAIQRSTINRVFNIMSQPQYEQVRLMCIEILIFRLSSQDVTASTSFIDALLLLKKRNVSEKIQKKLNHLLNAVDLSSMLTIGHLDEIYQEICKTGHFERQYELSQLLKMKQDLIEQPEKYSEMVAIKDREKEFFNPKKALLKKRSSSHLLEEIKIFSESLIPVSIEFFEMISSTAHLFSGSDLNKLSNLLEIFSMKQTIPNFMLEVFLQFPNQSLEQVMTILWMCLERKAIFSSPIISFLTSILLQHENPKFRNQACHAIKIMMLYMQVPEAVGSLIAVEYTLHQEDFVRKLYEHVCRGGQLSIGNAKKLLEFIQNDEFKKMGLEIFVRSTSDLSNETLRGLINDCKKLENIREVFQNLLRVLSNEERIRKGIDELFSEFPSFSSATDEIRHDVRQSYRESLNFEFIQLLLNKISLTTTIKEFLLLFSLLKYQEVNLQSAKSFLNGFEQHQCSPSSFIEVLERQILSQKLSLHSSHELTKIENSIISNILILGKQDWSFIKLNRWLDAMVSSIYPHSFDLTSIAHLLEYIITYKGQVNENDFYTLIEQANKKGTVVNTLHLHRFVVKKYLSSSTKEKSVSTLLDEIFNSEINEQIKKQIDRKSIRSYLNGIESFYRLMKEWTLDDVKAWAEKLKERRLNQSSETEMCEILAILKRVSVLLYGYEPRIVQLIAVILLNTRIDSGILAQISTGEGKSLVIAMLAVIKTLQGKTVDVITSSPVLASRDAQGFRAFFDAFSLKVDSNQDDHYQDGVKACYDQKIDVVYGDASHFKFDLLRHDYSGLKTRGDRKYHVVIMDEVDNVLVEGNDTLAILATPMPCMHELHPLLSAIYLKVVQLESLKFAAENNLSDTTNPFLSINRQDRVAVRILIESTIINDLNKTTNLNNDNGTIRIPNHLRKFVRKNLKDWIHSAYLAFYEYQLERDYVIKPNQEGLPCIAPVDFTNTGIIQTGTSWGEGLQQFLQMKHSLPLEPLSLVTNYMSVYSYILRYEERIGVTGTIGSKRLRELLQKMYGFSYVEIPTFLSKNNISLPTLILPNHSAWLESIFEMAFRETQLKRAVLIICESIDITKQVIEKFFSMEMGIRVIQYTDDKSDSRHFLENQIEKKSVIVATTLAGRGTDLSLSKEVKKHGGLHVCITFLPENSRVQAQAFGRASRRGEPGTVQMILNKESLSRQLLSAFQKDLMKIEQGLKKIEDFRDDKDAKKLNRFEEKKLPELKRQGNLFQRYLDLLQAIRVYDEKMASPLDSLKKEIWADEIYCEEFCKVKKMALEERWGRWLKDNQKKSDVLDRFEKFYVQMFNSYCNNTILDNPISHINLGNQLLLQGNRFHRYLLKKELFEKATKEYKKAIEIDPISSYNAHYHLAYILIQLKEKKYKRLAKEQFEKMLKALENGPLKELYAISLILNFGGETSKDVPHSLTSHLRNHLQAYHLLVDSAKNAIQQIEESQKLIGVSEDPYSLGEKYSPKKAKIKLRERKILSHPTMQVTFHHLKSYSESSQLIETVEKIPKEALITLSFEKDKLYSEEGKRHGLRMLLPINRYGVEEKLTLAPTTGYAASSSSVDSGMISSLNNGITWSLQAGKRLYRNVAGTIGDCWNDYEETENISVSLNLKQLTITNVVSLLNHVSFPAVQEFDIGPFQLNEVLLTFLRKYVPELDLLCTPLPSKKGKIEKNCIYSVSDLSLNTRKGMVTLLKCDAYDLKKIAKHFKRSLEIINLEIIKTDQKIADQCIQYYPHSSTLKFVDLNCSQMLKVLSLTSEEHNQSVLTVKHHDIRALEKLIDVSSRKEEPLNLNFHEIKGHLNNISALPSFMTHYQSNGFSYLYELQKELPLPWKSLAMLSVLSLAEIGGGMLLMGLTGGITAVPSVGWIAEGFVDVGRLISTLRSREFKFSDFAFEKSISMALKLLMEGGVSIAMVDSMNPSAMRFAFREGLHQCAIGMGEIAAKKGCSFGLELSKEAILEKTQLILLNQIKAVIHDICNKGDSRDFLNQLFAKDAFLKSTNEFSILEVNIRKLVVGLKTGNFNLLDGEFLNRFKEVFVNLLKERCRAIKNFKEILSHKHVDIEKSEIDSVYFWLENQKIISHGYVDLMELIKYLRDPTQTPYWPVILNIENYDLTRFTCSGSSVKRELFLKSCLEYVICCNDDFYLKRKELVQATSDLFYNHFSESLHQVAEITHQVLNMVSDSAISMAASVQRQGIMRSTRASGSSLKMHSSTQSVSKPVQSSLRFNARVTPSSHGMIRTLCQNSLVMMSDLNRFLIDRKNQLLLANEITQANLAKIALKKGQKNIKMLQRLRRERSKLIKCLIGIILTSFSIDGQHTLSVEDQDRVEEQIIRYFNLGKEELDNKREPTGLFLLEIGSKSLSNEAASYLKELKEAWEQYRCLLQDENEVLINYIQQTTPSLLGNVQREKFSKIGSALSNQNLSVQGFMSGLMIREVGKMIENNAKVRKSRLEATSRCKCMLLALTRETLVTQCKIMNHTLSMDQAFKRVARNGIGYQTMIGEKIVKEYKNFLAELINVSSIQDSSKWEDELNRITTEFDVKKAQLDQMVKNLAKCFKIYQIDQEVIKDCIMKAGNVVEQMIKLTRKYPQNTREELEVVFAKEKSFFLPTYK